MTVLLHSLEFDADREHFTLCLQLGAATPITYRGRAEEVKDPRGGTSFNSDDGSFEGLLQQLGEAERKQTLNKGTLGGLLILILEQKKEHETPYRRPPLCFPVAINGHDSSLRGRTWLQRLWAGVDKVSRHHRPLRAQRTEVV